MSDEVEKKTRQPAVIVGIMGPSGRGKTMLARTLDPETTLFVNYEQKATPFQNRFKYNITGLTAGGTLTIAPLIDQVNLDKKGIKTIVIDSFSFWGQINLSEGKKKFPDGFGAYGYQAEKTYEFLDGLRKLKDIIIFLISHTEMVTDETEAVRSISMSTEGKKFSGKLEAYMPIVLFATRGEESPDGRPTYILKTYQKKSTTKCPPGIFLDEEGKELLSFPNDGGYIVEKLKLFYNLP